MQEENYLPDATLPWQDANDPNSIAGSTPGGAAGRGYQAPPLEKAASVHKRATQHTAP